MPLPLTGTTQERYEEHLVYDGVTPTPGASFSYLEIENLVGKTAGVGASSPWCTPVAGQRSAYQDFGTSTAVGATTITDTGKAWVTNQWAGRVVMSLLGGSNAPTFMVITSNSATVLTGSGGWTNGTPSSGTAVYVIQPTRSPKQYDNWNSELMIDGNTNAW